MRARPESHVTDVRLVNTGSFAVSGENHRLGAEAAAGLGPFSVQGEYLRQGFERSDAMPDVAFDGWYAQASWFLTGEDRNYEAASGEFGRIEVLRPLGDGGLGAVEAAVRYSTIDLDDEEIRGGEEDNLTLGLNWWWNPYVAMMVNVVLADVEDGPENGDEDVTAVNLRFKADF